jgi:hypothetical protein
MERDVASFPRQTQRNRPAQTTSASRHKSQMGHIGNAPQLGVECFTRAMSEAISS